jgi:membrane protein
MNKCRRAACLPLDRIVFSGKTFGGFRVVTNLFSLSGYSFKEVAVRIWAEIRKDDVFGRAAQLAYYFFLALFPFLICVIASLSVFGLADRGRALLFQFLAGTLPPSAFQLLNATITDIIRASGPLKVSFGLIASLWSASAGMTAIMDTLNAAYDVRESRSLLKQYAVAVGLTVGITLLLVVSVVIVLFGDSIVNALSNGGLIAEVWKIAQWPLVLALILFAFAVTYYFAPDLPNRQWHWITPGAVLGLVLWMIVSVALRIYLHFFGSYSTTYGSLGAVIVMLLWFDLSGVAVLSGAALNGVLEKLANSASIPRKSEPISLQSQTMRPSA